MVVAARDVGAEGVLAGVASRAVATIVAEGDRLGEGHVQPQGTGDPDGHLGDLQGVSEAGPLVVLGEHEHLGLAGQAAKAGAVQDAVAVPFEARPERIGLLVDATMAGTDGAGGQSGQRGVLARFALGALDGRW